MTRLPAASRGCLRVRPDANADGDADANCSKTICRTPLKGVDIILYINGGEVHISSPDAALLSKVA